MHTSLVPAGFDTRSIDHPLMARRRSKRRSKETGLEAGVVLSCSQDVVVSAPLPLHLNSSITVANHNQFRALSA